MKQRHRGVSRLLLCGVSAVSSLIAPTMVSAQAAADEPERKSIERVIVTGSSIKRIEGETALPVQVLTREEIQRSGAGNVEQLLQSVASMASSGSLSAASASGAATGSISAISLRGLSSLRTLVLINGRRVSPYGIGNTNDSVSVDVNSIPVAAIERVEVLKDGASAVYGSDAIAGVVNFILRRDFRGAEIAASYGTSVEGGGNMTQVSGTYGYGSMSEDRFNVMLLASYAREGALYGRDRGFANSSINVGANNDTTSGNTFPANFQAADGSFGTRNPGYPNNCGPVSLVSPIYEAAGLINRCRYDPAPEVALFPKTDRAGLFVAGKLALTESIEGYAEGSFSRAKKQTIIQPSPISDQFTIPSNNPLANQFPYNGFTGGEATVGGLPYSTILLQSSSPYYPTALVQAQTGGATPDLLIRYRAVTLGNRDLTDISEAPRLTAGVKGNAADWDFDAGLLYSGSKVTEQVNGGFAYFTKLLPLLNSGQVNFFGPNTAATQAAIDATQFRGDSFVVKTSLTSAGAKASREFGKLPGGPFAIALGTEVRRETYNFEASEALEQGDLTGYGGSFASVSRSRTVDAFYGEVSLPLFTGFEADLAARFDHYGQVGSSTTPKIGLRYSPIKELLFRASAGRGFRAPSLADLYAPKTSGVSANGLTDPARCPTTGSSLDCNTQFPITNGGTADLKPEKSDNVSIGFVVEPTNRISFGIDAFKVNLKNTISNGVIPAFILADQVTYAALIQRGAPSPAFPNIPGPIINIDQTNLNTGHSVLQGFDLDFKWAVPTTAYGKYTLNLNGTYFHKFDVENPDGTYVATVDTVNPTTAGVIPRWKHRVSLDWDYGPVALTFAQNWQGSYQDVPGSFDDTTAPDYRPRRVGTYETYDLQGSYSGIKGLKLSLGARNIFNKSPPYTNTGGSIVFQAGYDPQYADPRGRFIYARFAYQIQ